MTNDKGILIQNIYYMLAYSFSTLRQTNYESVAAEAFENIESLFAEILARGIAQQLKQGLYREYVSKHEALPVLRGKLDINGTIRQKMQQKRILSCEYDELSENNILNQILKTTAFMLLSAKSVGKEQKNSLKKCMLFFQQVDQIELSMIHWNRLSYQRSNQSYHMLMNICYFVLEGMLQKTENGQYRMAQFDDEHMAHLYEKFILEYYRYHYPQFKASAARIDWNYDNDTEPAMIMYMPEMRTDITLRYSGRTLIIDAKYYGKTMGELFGAKSYHSNNLYQIYSYVKNEDKNHTGNVSGMLLYAKTAESITPNTQFSLDGNRFYVKTLDLNTSFSMISAQLNAVAELFMQSAT